MTRTLRQIATKPFYLWAKASILVLAAAFASTAALAQADDFPNRTIRIVVPVPPGGTADLLPRIVAEKLSQKWGQPVIIENRSGAGGLIGTAAVAKSEPDGYTLLSPPQAPLVISQHLRSDLDYDPAQFRPVTLLASLPFVLVAHPSAPYSTLDEFVAFAKANPGKATFASPGTGSAPHLAMEWLQTLAGIRVTHVPFRGSVPAKNSLLGGHVELMFDNLGNALLAVKDNSLKVLAVSSRERAPQLPNTPAIHERYTGFAATSWFAIVAPPGTPKNVTAKLSSAMAEAMRHPDVAKRIENLPATPGGTTPEQTADMIKEEAERWGKVIAAAGIKLK